MGRFDTKWFGEGCDTIRMRHAPDEGTRDKRVTTVGRITHSFKIIALAGELTEGEKMDDSLAIKTPVERRVNWRGTGVGMFLLFLSAIAIWMVLSQVGNGFFRQRQARAITTFEEETGIRILRIARTAGGGIIDLQYQVVDPDKALIIHDEENPPMLLDGKSNLIFAKPFHDHAARELHTAVTYHQLIMNGGGFLKRGSKVIIKVGDSRLEKTVVQ